MKKNSKDEAIKLVASFVEAAFRLFAAYILLNQFDYWTTTLAGSYFLVTGGLLIIYVFKK